MEESITEYSQVKSQLETEGKLHSIRIQYEKHCIEDPKDTSRSRALTVVNNLRLATQRRRYNFSPTLPSSTVLNVQEKEVLLDFDHTHFNIDRPVESELYNEASIEDHLDRDKEASHDHEDESGDDDLNVESHVELSQQSHDVDLKSHDQTDADDIVFTSAQDNLSSQTQHELATNELLAQTKPQEGAAKESEQTKVPPSYEDLMAEQRKQTEELRKKAGSWYRKLSLIHSLTMHTSFNRNDNDTPASVTALCISKDNHRLYVGDARGRIFSWTVSDNLESVMEHWLKDESVDNCMKCKIEFTLLERKHHCRDCGEIFCAKCSQFESEVKRLKITKKVRVCTDCFNRNLSLPTPTKL